MWDLFRSLPYLIADLIMAVFNAIILAVGTLLTALLGLLPGFPNPPGPPTGVIGALSWFVPIGTLLAGFAAFTALWITFLGIKIALKWVKAL